MIRDFMFIYILQKVWYDNKISDFERAYIYMIQNNKNSRKNFGIQNLTFMLIAGYAIGYILQLGNSNLLGYLTLDP